LQVGDVGQAIDKIIEVEFGFAGGFAGAVADIIMTVAE
jgi:hypothetical protein